eukprot:CAMPEP_0170878146 /NCGR_PEP_ID=MMETSP0734-20130129/30778_1 /TAXON_ID=186038 /ORGANISM="Fragilariopsis kerguelensis, Strain L26-C5" /LENGTH=345 /DNA_ID=CAMNT_0011260647 /DNA_START=144 /DNA_END=1181 /DNA_ORIENTATION=-
MMILNQVTRAFTSRKRRTSTLFRRPKTPSTINIDNDVEKKQDDCISLKKNHTVDDDDIVSTTSNSSSTIDLTPCSSARCVITTNSSTSMKRSDSIDINRMPLVPTLLTALQSDNADSADDITLSSIPSLRRSTSIPDDNDLDDTICSHDDDDDDESDFDCDDSCIFAPPPTQFVCVPHNFSHADALLHTQDSNCHIHNNILLLNRPPTRLGDWDHHTLESNPDDDDDLPDTGTNKGTRRNTATVATGTRTASSMTMKLLADRRHNALRRHQARTILSQNFPQLAASTSSSHKNDTNTLTLRRTLLSNLSNDDGKQQQQQRERQHSNQEEEQQRRQPRVVKWNMVR